MKEIIFCRGSFVGVFLGPAAAELGVDLRIIPDEIILAGPEKEVEFVNSFDDVIYLYFGAFGGNPIFDHAGLVKHPAIFWNVEDPNHFTLLGPQAKNADFIFTTAEECICDYQLLFPGKPVGVLTWACDPTRHYPSEVELGDREFDIVFVGNRYPREHERLMGEQAVLFPAIKWARARGKSVGLWGMGGDTPHSWKPVDLVWKDEAGREPGMDGYNGVFQEPSNAFDTGDIYRKATVVICLNEQIYSPTMTSMRTYEACGCGNIALSHASLATQNIFGGSVLQAGTPDETVRILDEVFLDDGTIDTHFKLMALKAASYMYEQHTYKHRLLTILEAAASLR